MSKYILVVDDSEGIRQLLYAILTIDGHQVKLAANGLEAIAIIKEKLPRLMFLDLNMPGCNGLEVLQFLKGMVRIRTIVISAYLEVGPLIDEGMVDYFIQKPFDVSQVREITDRLARTSTIAG